MNQQIVIVNDGQTEWSADRSALVAALDKLGWGKTVALGSRASTEPEGDDDHYTALCQAVDQVDMPDDTEAPHVAYLTYAPAERAWLWSR